MNMAKTMIPQGEYDRLAEENKRLREVIAQLIYSVTEEGYRAAREKAEKLIAPELPELFYSPANDHKGQTIA